MKDTTHNINQKTQYKHIPVMLNEVIEYLDPKTGEFFIDATLGGTGYTIEIAKKAGKGSKILGIDLDTIAIGNANFKIKKEKIKNIIIAQGNFADLEKIVKENFKNNKKFNGIIFDLGLSSAQLDDRERGFSFKEDTPLNMSFGEDKAKNNISTQYIINNYKENQLTEIIKKYGEEKFAKKIAQEIVKYRNIKLIETTYQLVEAIKKAIPKKYHCAKIHPATKTFQALRIATNKELENIEKALPQALNLLKKEGKIIVIAYHSLEDRIVKHFFKKQSQNCICPKELPICKCNNKAKIKILTKKPLLPSNEEIIKNPRSRSAKMRVIKKI